MRLKYSKTIIEAQAYDNPIADICWSPNSVKLAVATCDRAVLLFDRDGIRRDKFGTKPSDPAAGKKSYVITGLCFSDNSELLGVAQSDNMVFVYRLGADWNTKKVICNKFPLSGAPTKLLSNENGFFTGTTDGKIRMLDCKSNKSSSIWTASSCCVSLAKGSDRDGSIPLASGHVDGTLYLNGRLLLRYALPPTALALLTPYLVVGSCDGRIAVYEAQRGTMLRSIEPQFPPDRKDIISVSVSPSGQTLAFGVFDGCLIGELSESGALTVTPISFPNAYAVRATAWSGDGTGLLLGTQTGALLQLAAVLKRWVWRDAVEVQHVNPRQLALTRLAKDSPPMAVTTKMAQEIYNVRFIGNDWYAVCRTSSSLILCDLARSLTSEIAWSGSGERIYAAVGGACLIHRAGELSVVEYGLDRVLHTFDVDRGVSRGSRSTSYQGSGKIKVHVAREEIKVRTERVNPHTLSVRINEARSPQVSEDRKQLAYLLDRQTVAVLDLVTGVQVGQWWHEARIDWLELNETGHLLLYRDTRRRLTLLKLDSGDKEIIASGVGFVQWIENSDAVVAQTPTHLLIWYSAWDISSVEMVECGTERVKEVVSLRVLSENGAAIAVMDTHRLAYNNALRMSELAGCAKYLEGVGSGSDVTPLWRQLAEAALANDDIQLAAKCYREVGDLARTYFLEQTIDLANREGDGSIVAGLESPIVRAQLAIFAGDLQTAEDLYVKKANHPELAVQMYKQFNRWTEAIALVERTDRASVAGLRQQYMDYLVSTGRVGEAGAVLATSGDIEGAVRMWVKGGRARRAASTLLQHASAMRDTHLVDTVYNQLIQEEWWEMAAEIAERRGDHMTAVEYFAKGDNYARAVQLARESCPSEVTRLEGAWGAWLVGRRQAGAAVQHLIEAGDLKAALAAAIQAHHYRKALQCAQVIEDKESIKDLCEQIGDHFISVQDWETAERVFTENGMPEKCVRAYNNVAKYAEGLRLAAKHLSEEETRDIFLPLAQKLRDEGQLKKAEQIYIGLGEPDEAISMYKEASQYESMLRLVAAHRAPLLEATRKHVAQALHAAGDTRHAETYYLQAGDWKSAIQMYRAAGQWEQAERVARSHAPAQVQQQVVVWWAGSLGGAAGARLAAARGLAHSTARWALQANRWDIAYELCDLGGGITKREVARHEAAALAEDSPEEAEAAFLRAGAAEDAVTMWLTRGHHQRALVIAEQHATHMVEEVLVEGAKVAADRGDLAQFEALMIRANRPRDVVQHYKDLELWEEAGRVSREYLPDSTEAVPEGVPPLLQKAADRADRGLWWEAIECLCTASAIAAEGGAARLSERAALRAAKLARDRLSPEQRVQAAALLQPRFAAIGQHEVGERLRAALTEGFEEDDNQQEQQDTDDDESRELGPSTSAVGLASSSDVTNETLERLARAGHWERCLAQAGAKGTHYALRYAAYLFNTPIRPDEVDIESDEVNESLILALDALTRASEGQTSPSEQPLLRSVVSQILTRASVSPRAYGNLKQTAQVLVSIGADDRALQAITLLMALHVPTLASKAARSLPRYTDIIVADVAFYVCGKAIMMEGATSAREAFVFLNRCLDLAEAADDDSSLDLDHTDFECTDWPNNPLLLRGACVRGQPLDEIREWVLSVSMDQSVEQSLPVDNRGVYSSYVGGEESCCVLTGHPLSTRLVTFTNGRCANREWWSRVSSAARSGGHASDIINFITLWCGPPDYKPV